MTDEEVFELALYLVSCARLALEEPVVYGSVRLVEGASRLVAAAGGDDAFLRESRESIDGNKLKMIDDLPGYREWLTGLLKDFATEATRRNLGAEAAPSAPVA